MLVSMHPSLVDLAHQAPTCTSQAQIRGLIAESQELARNALHHGETAVDVARWYSGVVNDLLRSPALAEYPEVRPVGALARGEALPSTPLLWVSEHGPSPQSQFWEQARDVPEPPPQPELEQALAQRPPAMRTIDGLPDLNAEVDIHAHLIAPAATLAHWAAQTPALSTPERLAQTKLTAEEAEALLQAWNTGMELEAQRWRDRVPTTLTARELPALQRSAFGAAARSVSLVIRSVAARNNISTER
ncbi:hypothetical protein Clow_01767 [Corynebacterium lowii]|uniref:DUF294 domain-containing protein n=2 Tax=Corynebacterium lowii TaxID=1544413 RepID=A0A0Q0YUJ4_9CORY|nr:hypothetical protein Clow_01767 [Corynebacterium lowii]